MIKTSREYRILQCPQVSSKNRVPMVYEWGEPRWVSDRQRSYLAAVNLYRVSAAHKP